MEPTRARELTHRRFSGLLVYAALNGLVGLVVCLSGGRVEPYEYELKEYWTWKGSGRPPWFVRALRGARRHQGQAAQPPEEHGLEARDGRGSSTLDSQAESVSNEYAMSAKKTPVPAEGGSSTLHRLSR